MNLMGKIMSSIVPFSRCIPKILKGKEIGFSFNLADRCPVGCNCYWRAAGRVQELSDSEVVRFFHEQKKQGKLHVTIVGGEPYVRPELLRMVAPIMHGSWVVTSATTPLMVLPKTTHFISIDGKDASTHDGIRKTSGLYDRVLKNLTAIRRTNKFPAYIHTVLNTQNYRQIEEILHVWRNNRLVDGVIFSIMTRIKNSGCDDDLLLNNSQQKWVIKELLKQKKIFGEFLCMTKKMILMYEPERTRQQKPASCATARFISSFDASGEKIPQCIFSDKGDCSKCGCVITTMIDAITHFPPSPTTIKLLARMYNP